MGNVYKILGKAKVKPSPKYYSERLVVELCENVHIHYRNIRWELSYEEFFQFTDVMTEAAKLLRATKKK